MGACNHAAAAYQEALYVIGGDQRGASANVQSAALQVNGTTQAWAQQTSLPVEERYNMVAAVTGSQLYVIGGNFPKRPDRIDEVLMAQTGPGGELSGWVAAKSRLRTPRGSHGAVIVGEYLYVIGGQNQNGRLGSVEYARILRD